MAITKLGISFAKIVSKEDSKQNVSNVPNNATTIYESDATANAATQSTYSQ